jgi:hypothetical protein
MDLNGSLQEGLAIVVLTWTLAVVGLIVYLL